MTSYELIANVFFANVMTVSFVWGMARARHVKEDRELTWPVFWAVMAPLCVALLCFIASGSKLPFLGALAFQ